MIRSFGARAVSMAGAIVLLASATVGGAYIANAPSVRATPPPNIVVIEIDDMRYDEMPFLTKTLAALPGTSFTNSFVSTSLCCPSRAGFLSGQYVQNHLVVNNNAYNNFNHNQTIATSLSAGGYYTAQLGKYMNGYSCGKAQPQGWTDWQALCKNIYGYTNYSINDNGVVTPYGSTQADYVTDVLAGRAEATVDAAVTSGNPFFMWLNPTAPHSGTGIQVAARYVDSFKPYNIPQGGAFNEANVSDKPLWVRALPLLTGSKINGISKSQATRLRKLLAVDDMIERTINRVAANGQMANTIFVVTSDNGFMRGEHRVPLGKDVLYRDSIAVPLLISGPGIPVGTNSALVTNTDLAQTIQAWSGTTSPRVQDGRSLLDAIANQDYTGRAVLHSQVNDITTPKHPGGWAVQADQFIYIETDTGEKELYDHAVDPFELINVHGDAKYSPVVAQLTPMLAALKTCSGATCQVVRSNIAPVAEVSPTCTGGIPSCDFSSIGSLDIDGSIASYAWDFGDGNTSTSANPHHDYAAGGPYTVALTVTDNRGSTHTVNAQAGSPNTPPTASFSFSVSGAVVDFDATASADDGSIVAYDWDFGDSQTGTGSNPNHDYINPGTYTVVLTVTDNNGASDTDTQDVTIS